MSDGSVGNDGFSLLQRVVLFLLSLLGPLLIWLYGSTWRIKWEGIENLQAAREARGKVFFCFWHSRLLGLCYTHRYRNIGIMVSRSFDGEWISRVVVKLGYRAFRGSASRNGAAALAEMIKDSSQSDLALTVDGPRGPAEKVKPGALSLASNSGLPIVPISCVARSAWRLQSWDRFVVPKPFTTLTVKYGKKIDVPPQLDDGTKSRLVREIEDGINRIS